MSDSVRPHRRQPTRLPHPWDSPGKNTGVGCHFLLQCMKVKSQSEVAQSSLTLMDPMDCNLAGSSVHGIFQARVLEWVAIAFSPPVYWKPYIVTGNIKKIYSGLRFNKIIHFVSSRLSSSETCMVFSPSLSMALTCTSVGINSSTYHLCKYRHSEKGK